MSGTGNIEARLRARAMAELKASRSLWAEYRREKRARRTPPSLQLLMGLGLTGLTIAGVFVTIGLAIGMIATLGPDLALATTGVASTCASLAFAQKYLLGLRRSAHISTLSHLPISDAALARKVWQRTTMFFLPSAYIIAVLHGAAALELGLGIDGWTLAIGLAFVQAALIVALGTILAIHRPHLSHGRWGIVMGIVAFGVIVASESQPQVFPRGNVVELFETVTPGGWVAGVLGRGFLQNNLRAWLGLPAAVGLIVYTIPTVQKLSSAYRITAFELRQGQDVKAVCFEKEPDDAGDLVNDEAMAPAGDNAAAELNALLEAKESAVTESEAETIIREGTFLRALPEDEFGWVERFVLRRLPADQRLTIDFFSGEETNWTLPLTSCACSMLALVGIGQVFQLGSAIAMPTPMLFFMFCLSQLVWQGTRRYRCGGTIVTHWVNAPVGFDESFRALYRVSFFRTLLMLPVAIAIAIIMQVAFAWPFWALGGVAAGLLIFQVIVPTATATIVLTTGGRLPFFRWWRLPFYILHVIVCASPLVGLILLFHGLLGIIQPIAFGFGLAFLSGGIVCLIGSAWLIRYYCCAIYRKGLIDWVSARRSPLEERMLQNQEKQLGCISRARLLREKFGRFWWLKPRLRRWYAGEG